MTALKSPSLRHKETIAVPIINCSLCGMPTVQGLHQIRLKPVKQAEKVKINGKWKIKPAVMKREDVYMCLRCVKEGKKWPGKKFA